MQTHDFVSASGRLIRGNRKKAFGSIAEAQIEVAHRVMRPAA
jgi:hypothetical protein